MFIAGTAMMTYYWVYVQRESDYFANRNFRKLAMLSHQPANGEPVVSLSVMAFLSGLLLFAIFSWPFVKLTLIGTLQRVRFREWC